MARGCGGERNEVAPDERSDERARARGIQILFFSTRVLLPQTGGYLFSFVRACAFVFMKYHFFFRVLGIRSAAELWTR